jgi:hypothetical protein
MKYKFQLNLQSQMMAELSSEQEPMRRPLGENLAQRTQFVWCVIDEMKRRLPSVFHNLTDLSSLEVTMWLPSGENCTERTAEEWAMNSQ